MSSIVLEPAVKEMLLADCRDFLRSEDWYVHYLEFTGNMSLHVVCRYAERGGFILIHCARKNAGIHGPVFGKESPSDVGICYTACREGTLISRNGNHVLTSSLSGKTSLIHSLAGELGLDIYVVSLSSKGCVCGSFPSFHQPVNLGE